MRDSASFLRTIDDGRHVIELHAWRSPETCTVAAFTYEKGQQQLLRYMIGIDENDVIRRAVEWCEANS